MDLSFCGGVGILFFRIQNIGSLLSLDFSLFRERASLYLVQPNPLHEDFLSIPLPRDLDKHRILQFDFEKKKRKKAYCIDRTKKSLLWEY